MQNQIWTCEGSRSKNWNFEMIGIAIGMMMRMIEMRSSTNPATKARRRRIPRVAHPERSAASTRFWVPTRPPEIVNTVAKMLPASRMVRIIAVTRMVFESASFSTGRLKFR